MLLPTRTKIEYCLRLPATAEGITPGSNQSHWQKLFRYMDFIFQFLLVYNPYWRQFLGKIFLSIGQFAHEASSGYDTDTPSMFLWPGERLSQVLAETNKTSVQHQKIAGMLCPALEFCYF